MTRRSSDRLQIIATNRDWKLGYVTGRRGGAYVVPATVKDAAAFGDGYRLAKMPATRAAIRRALCRGRP